MFSNILLASINSPSKALISSGSEDYINDLNNLIYSTGMECRKNKLNLVICDYQSLSQLRDGNNYLDSMIKFNDDIASFGAICSSNIFLFNFSEGFKPSFFSNVLFKFSIDFL